MSNNHPWKLEKIVLPQHTDHAGVMWHGAYISWLEEARIKALADVGLPYGKLSLEGYEMPVVSLKVNYISALLHGDQVVLSSSCLQQEGARWPWETSFLKQGNVVANARVDLVLLKIENKRRRLLRNAPDNLREAFLTLHKGPAN